MKNLFCNWTNFYATNKKASSIHHVSLEYLLNISLVGTTVFSNHGTLFWWNPSNMVLEMNTWRRPRPNIFTWKAVLNFLFQNGKMLPNGNSTRATEVLMFVFRKNLNAYVLHTQQFHLQKSSIQQHGSRKSVITCLMLVKMETPYIYDKSLLASIYYLYLDIDFLSFYKKSD